MDQLVVDRVTEIDRELERKRQEFAETHQARLDAHTAGRRRDLKAKLSRLVVEIRELITERRDLHAWDEAS